MGDRGYTATSRAVRLAVCALLSGICLLTTITAFALGGSSTRTDLRLEKYAGTVSTLGDDLYSVPFTLKLFNTGTEPLKRLQVIDDVAREMAPAQLVSVSGLQAAGALQDVNPGFDGDSDARLLNGSDILAPGAQASIRFSVIFTSAGQTGPFFNQATATAKGAYTGTLVSKCSLSPNNSEDKANLTNFCQPTAVELPESGPVPVVGLAKAADPPEWLGDGWFRTRITLTAHNYGEVKAFNVQIYDDLGAGFADAAFEIETLTSPTWPVNPAFNGTTDLRLLRDGAYLHPGAEGQVFLTLRFRPKDALPVYNSACASVDGGACDRSTDGTDPDPGGDCDPQEAETTVIYQPAPSIGLATSAAPVRYPEGRRVEVDLTVVLRNMGNTPLSGIRVHDDLSLMFGQEVESFSVLPGSLRSDTLSVNPDYDGDEDTNLLGDEASLAPDETAAVFVTISFVPVPDEGAFENQSFAETDQGAGDVSTDGSEPDPDGDGSPQERLPTVIAYRLPPRTAPLVGLAKDASVATAVAPGVFETTLTFYLANPGTVPLSELCLTDDLATTFPEPATFQVVTGSLASAEFVVNEGFDGSAETNLLAPGNVLAAGLSGSVSVRVRIQPNGLPGPFFNQAFIGSAEGAEDLSNAGSNPDPDGSTKTPIRLDSHPGISVEMTASPVETISLEDDVYLVSFQIIVTNLGDVSIDQVQVVDDLSLAFPAPTEFSVIVPPSVSGGLQDTNPGYGSAGFELLSETETLAVGERATIEFTVRFTTRDDTDVFFNEALARAVDPDGNAVFDQTDVPVRIEVPGHLRGTVFLDLDHDGTFDPSADETLDGWGIELLGPGQSIVRSASSANAGTYSVADIRPTGYAIQFRHPETGVVWARFPLQIVPRQVTVVDLPIDPQGVVYDAVTRAALPGVELSLLDDAGRPLPDVCLLPGQQGQPVGRRGMYRFTILHGADPDRCPQGNAEYRITASGVPDGYQAGISQLIPPETEPFDADTCAAPCLIQPQNDPPATSSTATYHDTFRISASGATVVNNHFPVDPLQVPPPPSPGSNPPELTIETVANHRSTTVGSVVGYTTTLENRSDIPIAAVQISDRPSPAFQLQTDSALIVRAGMDGLLGTPDDLRSPLGANGTSTVSFTPVDVAPGERLNVLYVSRVSTAAKSGFHINTAAASHLFEGTTYTVTDTASVEVKADPLFTRATVIGKVFYDETPNGIQDDGEPGMGRIRLITPEGLIVVTDAEGRFHIADIEITRDYGANYALKLDANTLPDGWESRSDPRQVVHLAPGGIGKISFAVAPRSEPPPTLPSDCCGKYQEFRYLDPFQTEKRLDVRPVTLSRIGSDWTLTFGVSSNYNEQAPYYRLDLYDPDSFGLSPPLESACGVLDFPHRFVRLGKLSLPGRDRLVYTLKVYEGKEDPRQIYATSKLAQPAYPDLRCDEVERASRRPFDITHAQELHLPDLPGDQQTYTWPAGQTGSPGVSPGSALAVQGILINRAVQARAERRYLCEHCGIEDETRDRLIDRETPLLEDIRGNPAWEVQPKINPEPELDAGESGQNFTGENVAERHELPTGIDLEVKFDSEPGEVGRAWLQRDVLFEPHDIVYGAAGLETSMKCCDVETSIETVTDQDNNVYAIRLRNNSHNLITPAFSGLEGCDAASADAVSNLNAPVQAYATREYYLGGFRARGPRADRCWSEIHVDLESAELPGKPMMKYVIKRQRFEEDGQWRPPRTTAYCLQVEGQPQITEDLEVAAIRVNDGDLTRDERSEAMRPLENVETNFGIAVIDLTVGGRSASGGLDDLAEDLSMDGTFADGRVAAYWRGVANRGETDNFRWVVQVDSTKDDLDNLFDNLKRKDPNRIFRQLDTDHYYPTYGDDSTTTLDTDSQGAFYARVASNRSHALWGNYNTGLTDTEFAQYDRSLYGALGDYRSKALTGENESRFELKVFGSEAQTASGQASFLATGGSLYYLPHTDIVMGSEKVWVEVRRRDSEQVEERQILLPGRDYEVDPLQGRILLQSPLAQVVRDRLRNVIRSRPLEGDDVILYVDYEYHTLDFAADDYVYGVRGRAWLDDRLAVGATHVTDEQGAEDYQLNGLDLLWRIRPDSYLSAEFARSESERGGASAFSFDGGLTFEDDPWNTVISAGEHPDALGLEARVNLEDFGARSGLVRAWWKEREAGFSSGRFVPGPETTDLGFDFETGIGDRWTISGGATELDREDDRRASTARLQSGGRWQCGSGAGERGCVELDLEVRYEDLKLSGSTQPMLPYAESDGGATLLGARAGYWLSDATTLYTSVQTAVSTRGDYEDNGLVALGTNTRFSNRLAMSLEASDGDRGSALIAGADYRVNERASFNVSGGVGSGALSRFAGRYELSEGQELFGTYTMDPDRTDGARNLLSVGQRSDLGDRTRIFTESQFGRGFGEYSNGHVGGLELDVDGWVLSTTVQASSVTRRGEEFDRVAASIGATFEGQATRLSSRIEVRNDDGPATDTRQYVTSNALMHQLNDDARLIGKLNLAWTDDRLADVDAGRFAEFALGYAYRPTDRDRLNGMMRYAYLYDVGTLGQSDAPGDEKAHVGSLEGFFDVTARLQVGGKLAYRGGKSRIEKGTGDWYDLSLGMAIARASFTLDLPREGASGRILPDQIELLGEYRWLEDFEGNSTKRGALLGIYREIDPRHWTDDASQSGAATLKPRLLPPSIRVGVGYNFSGFDDDMRMDNYKSHGWFVDLMAVF